MLEHITNAKVVEIQAPKDNLVLKQQEVDPADWYVICGSRFCVVVDIPDEASVVAAEQENPQLRPLPQVA